MNHKNPINYRSFRNSQVRASEVGLGCASAWGQPWFDEAKAISIGRRALELGVTVFDTGPSYSRGYAEPRMAKVIRGIDVSRFLISTKVGTHIGPNGRLYHDLSRDAILSSVEASRRRLDLDMIPLLYLHGPRLPELDHALFDTLEDLKFKGWVRWLGVNSFDTSVLGALIDIPLFDAVMLDYNVLRSYREPLIDSLANSGKYIVAGAAVANHLFAPGFLFPKSYADVWYLLRALKNYRRDLLPARRFAALDICSTSSPAQVALSFVLSYAPIGTAMFGTTRIQHLEENLEACGRRLSDDSLSTIRGLSSHSS